MLAHFSSRMHTMHLAACTSQSVHSADFSVSSIEGLRMARFPAALRQTEVGQEQDRCR